MDDLSKPLSVLEEGIRTVFREAGESAARSICVGELKQFGEAVILEEKLKASLASKAQA